MAAQTRQLCRIIPLKPNVIKAAASIPLCPLPKLDSAITSALADRLNPTGQLQGPKSNQKTWFGMLMTI